MKRIIKYTCAVASLIFLLAIAVSAHSGRTDSNGGHYNHSTGEYHYHHGYSAHQHYDMDGDGAIDCPYEFKDKTNHSDASKDNATIEDPKIEEPKIEDDSETITLGYILFILLKIIGMFLMISVFGLVVWWWVYTGLCYLISWICKKMLKKEVEDFKIGMTSIIVIGVIIIIIASVTVLGSEGVI